MKRSGGLKAERIVLPGRANPLMLRPSSKALLLLQRVRDESHRFAIEFQRELRSKVNLTSILEELPGIGPKKKRALLRTLGSLRAVREASVEELSAVEGISARDAETLAAFFRSVAEEAQAPSERADDEVPGAAVNATSGPASDVDWAGSPETEPEAPSAPEEEEGGPEAPTE